MNHGYADISTLDNNELCDQCRALVFAITKLTCPITRDTLLWVLADRLDMLGLRFEQQEALLDLS
ncbi:hypothetical protein QLG07_17495 [Erwinia sp. V90_4]|uniref:hypothetical protein n=1 Tax=Erwinia sp. V90_4 TaxID=3044239 RepID=UPI00249E0434|nr:hypothetical protein [Erwinia sp. V90_4]MDI3441262.1 hypothetical protein [Erwinia sp. V90_4]